MKKLLLSLSVFGSLFLSVLAVSAQTSVGPSIKLLSPNGGESYKAGDYVPIKWLFSSNKAEKINLGISVTNQSTGASISVMNPCLQDDSYWQTHDYLSAGCLNFSPVLNDTFLWKIPAELGSGKYKMVLQGIDMFIKSEVIRDSSDDSFTITSSASTSTTPTVPGSTFCYTWTRNLKIGDRGADVLALLKTLNKEGLLNNSTEGLYGSADQATIDEGGASAVVGFQEKYASEILTPNGLSHGTGYVGASTRAKLNKLYGCSSPYASPSPTPLPNSSPHPLPPTSACYPFNNNLTIGSTGVDVVALQTWLIANGFEIPAISTGGVAKGYYGLATAQAVSKYQISSGLLTSNDQSLGYFGPSTRAKLNSNCNTVIVPPVVHNISAFLLSAPSIDFVAYEGDTGFQSKSVTFNNTSGSSVKYSIVVDNQPAWLNTGYSKDILTSTAGYPTGIGAGLDPKNLSVGNYSAKIQLVGDFPGSPVIIPVNVTIKPSSDRQITNPEISSSLSQVSSGGTSYFQFKMPSNTTSAKLSISCATGVSAKDYDDMRNQIGNEACNANRTIGINSGGIEFLVSNNSSQSGSITATFTTYSTDSPTYGRTASVVVNVLPGSGTSPSPVVNPTPTQSPTYQSIQIIQPNGGGGYIAGQRMSIIWKNSNLPTNLTIDGEAFSLINANGAEYPITIQKTTYFTSGFDGNFTNNGYSTYDWMIDSSIPAGTYRLKIKYSTSTYGSEISDLSDSSFNITSSSQTPSITIQYPTTGSAVNVGSTMNIRWSTVNIPADRTIDIGLYPSGNTSNGIFIALNDPTSKNDGTQSYTIPSSLAAGKYRLQIGCHDCLDQFGYNPYVWGSDFTINPFGTASPTPTANSPVTSSGQSSMSALIWAAVNDYNAAHPN
jgi:hypothetical protein